MYGNCAMQGSFSSTKSMQHLSLPLSTMILLHFHILHIRTNM